MSDQAYAPPADGASVFDSIVLTGVIKVISVICIVFGSLGVLQGLLGVASLVGQSAVQELSLASVPPHAQDAARQMFEVTGQLMPVAAVFVLVGLAISGSLIYAGVTALTSRKARVLQLVTGATAAYIVVAELGFALLFNNWWINDSKTAYLEALMVNNPAAGAGMESILAASTIGGLALGGIMILVRLAFYVWAFTAVKSFNGAVAQN